MTMTLEKLKSANHPYYCSESNFYSNESGEQYDTVTEFLDEWEDADVDMNLVFRWDVNKYDNEDHHQLKVFIMQQRKGIFYPIHVREIVESDCQRLEQYLLKHHEKLKELWKPFK